MSFRDLQKEAANFRKLRVIKPNKKAKPLTTRRFFAGQALAGILARSPSWINKNDIVREAYELADKMLEED